jgi:serine/threonine-protein kinase
MAEEASAKFDLPEGIPRPGEVMASGKYAIEREIAAGGMGIVLSAMHLQLGARVAIKFLHPDATKYPEAVPRFLTEARAAARISSEHVVRIIDVDMLESGAPYIVMEYLAGEDLADIIAARAPLALPEALELFLQACEGVAEAHARGIVHRDLKPPNLFVTKHSDGTPLVKVLDFGLVKATDPRDRDSKNLTKATAVMGTPQYMSPEQVRSSRDVDARTDVWSLGVILYEMLAGKPPFEGDTSAAICASVVADPPPPLAERRPGLAEGVVTAVHRCLEKDPEKRFANIAALADAIGPFAPRRTSRLSVERILKLAGIDPDADDGPVDAATAAQRATARTLRALDRIESRRRGLRVAAAAATFLLVAAVLWVWTRGDRSTDASPRPGTVNVQTAAPATAEPMTALPATAAAETAAPATEEPETAATKRRPRHRPGTAGGDLDIRLQR